jgi:hypothetical protein
MRKQAGEILPSHGSSSSVEIRFKFRGESPLLPLLLKLNLWLAEKELRRMEVTDVLMHPVGSRRSVSIDAPGPVSRPGTSSRQKWKRAVCGDDPQIRLRARKNAALLHDLDSERRHTQNGLAPEQSTRQYGNTGRPTR